MGYVELQVTTNFSFLRGGSHADEYMLQAAYYGMKAIGITDRNTLAGIVRAHTAAKKLETDMRLIVGCRLDLEDGPSLLAYPTDVASYGRLSKLLTAGKLRAEKGKCHLFREDIYAYAKGLKLVAVSPERIDPAFEGFLREYREAFGRDLSLAATAFYNGDDQKRLVWLKRLASKTFTPLVATGDVHYHHPDRQELQDILTCIREKCTIKEAGYKLFANAERHLKPAREMKRLMLEHPEAIKRTLHIAEACTFSLNELKYQYPDEATTDGRTAHEELTHHAWLAVKERCGDDPPPEIVRLINKELSLIDQLGYAAYFLTAYDVVKFARSQRILCQGRGSAANSAVCFFLGITAVNPSEVKLLFERFISTARREPPDIDIDFEHERREEVMQYVYAKYGRHRAAVVATVSVYRQKGALKDVGKAMGLSKDLIEKITKSFSRFHTEFPTPEEIQKLGFDPNDQHLRKTMMLAAELLGFPRHLSQHSGGFVIEKDDLSALVPVMNAAMDHRTCIEWDKDDIDALGMQKLDLLSIGMVCAIQKTFDYVLKWYGVDHDLTTIPRDCKKTFEMIGRADTVGTFQIESRAQMDKLVQTKPTTHYDLIVQVAIVRPGPIQGGVVHPYIRRRQGLEKVTYPSPELEAILKPTYGIAIFQEQAMEVAIVGASFTPAEADELRRSIGKFRGTGVINHFEEKLIGGMVRNGYSRKYAEDMYSYFQGFGSYGFPQSHAASYGQLAYSSAWLKCHYPDAFTCALMNCQPMGFYSPAQLIIDVRKTGIEVRPPDINYSDWDCTLEEYTGKHRALRLGFRQVTGLHREDIERLVAARYKGYDDIATLWNRAAVSVSTLEKLADADAFNSMGLNRREALWQIRALGSTPMLIFNGAQNEGITEQYVALPEMSHGEAVINDYAVLKLSLKGHPVQFLRSRLSKLEVTQHDLLPGTPSGKYVRTAGLVTLRQMPQSANDVIFATIEDETGIANLIMFRAVWEQFRAEVFNGKLLMASGILQRHGEGMTHIIVRSLSDLTPWLDILTPDHLAMPMIISRSDEVIHGVRGSNRGGKAMPASKDFQ